MITRSRAIIGVGIAVTSIIVVGGCSSDDEPSAEEQFCTAGAALSDDVSALAEFDVLTNGLDGMSERFDTIRADVDALQEAGLAVAADEIDALEASVGELEVTASSLSESPNLDGASTAIGQLATVVSDAAAVFEVYTSTCD